MLNGQQSIQLPQIQAQKSQRSNISETNQITFPTPLQQLKVYSLTQKQLDRYIKWQPNDVGNIIVCRNSFDEYYVSFDGPETKNPVYIFENENLDPNRIALPQSNNLFSPQNYLYYIINGKIAITQKNILAAAGYVRCDRISLQYNYLHSVIQSSRMIATLRYGQMINQVAGQTWVTQKNKLASTINEYWRRTGISNLIPKSYRMPEETEQLRSDMANKKDQFYIYKPIFNSRGKGIKFFNYSMEIPQDKDAIVQEYIQNPLLLNGYKFDFRIYVVLLNVEPLMLYIYKEGMVRFCTEKYQQMTKQNLTESRMHLTNFEQNRFNDQATEDKIKQILQSADTEEEQILELQPGFYSKQSLTHVLQQLDEHRECFSDLSEYKLKNSVPGDGRLKRQIWDKIKFNIQSIIQSCEPYMYKKLDEAKQLYQYPRRMYALYGFDIILNNKGHPYCLEINTLPSMEVTTRFDQKLKYNLQHNIMKLVQPLCVIENDQLRIPGIKSPQFNNPPLFSYKDSSRRQNIRFEELTELEQRVIREVIEAEKRLGDFERIVPNGDFEYLNRFVQRRPMEELINIWIHQYGMDFR